MSRRRELDLSGRCTLAMIARPAIRLLVGVGLLAATLGAPTAARAAGEVVVSASPVDVLVGQPLEVLLRTFLPIPRDGTLAVGELREPYPGPSGMYNLLYPWEDYPFDVVVTHEDGTEVQVTVARDPSDSTLWRGVTSLPKAGRWTIWVRNFPNTEPGATTVVIADVGPPALIEAASDDHNGPAALVGALLGLLGGFAIAILRRRRQLS